MNGLLPGRQPDTAIKGNRWFSAGLTALLLLFFLLSNFTSAANAAIPSPPAELYVLDQAGVMSSDTKSLIINTSQELARQTKAQVAVVTLNSLEGQPIEQVALQIGRQWQLGDKQLNNGVLILVAPNERKSRIEVGYGLEGALPDGKTGRIQDDYMLPYFREGNYDLGIVNGYKAVIAEVAKEYGVTINIAPAEQPATQTTSETPWWVTIMWVVGIIMLLWLDQRFFNGFILGFLLGTLFRGGGRGGGGFGGGGFGGGSSGGGGSFGGGGSSRGW